MHIVLRNCDGAVAYDLRQHEHITTSSFSLTRGVESVDGVTEFDVLPESLVDL